jgi:hypothetical protein
VALKFVKRATPGAKPRKVRIPRKSAMLLVEKPRSIVQDYAAIDQFGELGTRKREAAATARRLGHDLLPWHERPNDPAGRWNAFCTVCNKAVVVCTEAPQGLPWVYGHALTDECPS